MVNCLYRLDYDKNIIIEYLKKSNRLRKNSFTNENYMFYFTQKFYQYNVHFLRNMFII